MSYSSVTRDAFDEMCHLVEASLGGAITSGERRRLDQLVHQDASARELYLKLVFESSILLTWSGHGDPQAACNEEVAPSASLVPSPNVFWGGAANSLSSGWLTAYLVATVVVTIGIAIAGFTHVSSPEQFATVARTVPEQQRAVAPKTVIVGRITGMVDCQWNGSGGLRQAVGANTKSEIRNSKSPVSLGDTFDLHSGLLEITYDTGAKVILQGPVRYEVESASGGYLAIGKLTARLEKKAGASCSSSLSPPLSSLFAVHTPTAVVTDLGTEFGVEVGKDKQTSFHVFEGVVEITTTSGVGEMQTRRLHANESACTTNLHEGNPKGVQIVVSRDTANADRFVRQLNSGSSGAARIVETFAGDVMSPAFEQIPPGRYVLDRGATYRQSSDPEDIKLLRGEGLLSRGYIRTLQKDFCNRDFTFETVFDVHLRSENTRSTRHWIFFGIGDGAPNVRFYNEVKNALVLGFIVDDGRVSVRLCHPDSTVDHDADQVVAEVVPDGGLKSGRHRFRMWKTGKWVTFAIDSDFESPYGNYFQSPALDLHVVAPLLNEENSRLFVGAGDCDIMTVRFEELLVTHKMSRPASDSSAKSNIVPHQ